MTNEMPQKGPSNPKIKVVLVDDHRMVRTGLRALLKTVPGVDVIGEAEDGRAAVTMSAKLKPDLLVMDVAMPQLNGIEATRQITGVVNGPKVIALSSLSDKQSTTAMLKAGASGYLLKASAFEELALAIQTVMANKVYLSPDVAGTVVEEVVRSEIAELSPREREVLQLIAEGKSTKETALHLHVSVKTIETHRKNIMDKLDLHSVADLTKYAIRQGIVSLDA